MLFLLTLISKKEFWKIWAIKTKNYYNSAASDNTLCYYFFSDLL